MNETRDYTIKLLPSGSFGAPRVRWQTKRQGAAARAWFTVDDARAAVGAGARAVGASRRLPGVGAGSEGGAA